jgi:trimeric autotransporter adhesin
VFFRSISARAINLAVQAALVGAGTVSAGVAGTSSPAVRPPTFHAFGSGGNDVVSHPVPPRSGLIGSTPRASWIPDTQVNALATDGTYVYLGGTFTALVNPATGLSQPHTRLARINIATGVADGTWSPTVNGTIRALAYSAADSTLFVGGLFTDVNGAARTNLAGISTTGNGVGTGAVRAMAPNPDDEVRALMMDQGELVVGGSFLNIAGFLQRRLAKLDPTTGARDTTFTPQANAGVFAITHPPGSGVYAVGGAFTTLGNNPHSYLGLVNRTTGAPSSWSPSALCPPTFICPVISVASNGAQIFAAAGGPGGQAIGYDLATGTRQWVQVANGNTQAIVVFGQEVYVGGHFDPTFGNQHRQTLAAVNARSGAIDPSFRPSAKSTFPGTEALLPTPDGLIVGGAQLNIGGTAQSRFAIFPVAPVSHTVRRPVAGMHG